MTPRKAALTMAAVLTAAGTSIGAPPAHGATSGLLIEVVLYSHFTQTGQKCAGTGIYNGINEDATLLVWSSAGADVANKAGAGVDPSGPTCRLFYGLHTLIMDQYQLQFMSPSVETTRKFGPYTTSLMTNPEYPSGTRQLFADLP